MQGRHPRPRVTATKDIATRRLKTHANTEAQGRIQDRGGGDSNSATKIIAASACECQEVGRFLSFNKGVLVRRLVELRKMPQANRATMLGCSILAILTAATTVSTKTTNKGKRKKGKAVRLERCGIMDLSLRAATRKT